MRWDQSCSLMPKRRAMPRPIATSVMLMKDSAATSSTAPAAHIETIIEPITSVPGDSRYTPVEYSRENQEHHQPCAQQTVPYQRQRHIARDLAALRANRAHRFFQFRSDLQQGRRDQAQAICHPYY